MGIGRAERRGYLRLPSSREPVLKEASLRGPGIPAAEWTHSFSSRCGEANAMAKSSKGAQRFVSRHVRRHKKKGMPQSQAVAAALSEARRKGKRVPPRRRAKAGRKSTKRTSRKRKSR
jgi:hypothetical protein